MFVAVAEEWAVIASAPPDRRCTVVLDTDMACRQKGNTALCAAASDTADSGIDDGADECDVDGMALAALAGLVHDNIRDSRVDRCIRGMRNRMTAADDGMPRHRSSRPNRARPMDEFQ